MRVAYLPAPGCLDQALPLARELSRSVELHLVLEISPRAWVNNALGLPHPGLAPGVHDGAAFLRQHLPRHALTDLSGLASARLAVYPSGLSLTTLRVSMEVARAITDFAPDLLHFEGESARTLSWLPLVGRRFVLSVHEVTVPRGSGYSEIRVAKRVLIPRAAHIIARGTVCAHEIDRRYHVSSGSMSVVPLGPPDYFRAWQTQAAPATVRRKCATFFGRLTPRKGVDVFIEAARRLAEVMPQTDFVVAGLPERGVIPPPAQKLATSCSLQVLPRRLAPRDVAELLSRTTVLVAPYRHARQSGVVMTAYAFGIPVVASDIPGLRDQVRTGVSGLLVAAGDPEALAAAVGAVLADSEARDRLSQGALRMSETECGWTAIVGRTVGAYRSVLDA